MPVAELADCLEASVEVDSGCLELTQVRIDPAEVPRRDGDVVAVAPRRVARQSHPVVLDRFLFETLGLVEARDAVESVRLEVGIPGRAGKGERLDIAPHRGRLVASGVLESADVTENLGFHPVIPEEALELQGLPVMRKRRRQQANLLLEQRHRGERVGLAAEVSRRPSDDKGVVIAGNRPSVFAVEGVDLGDGIQRNSRKVGVARGLPSLEGLRKERKNLVPGKGVRPLLHRVRLREGLLCLHASSVPGPGAALFDGDRVGARFRYRIERANLDRVHAGRLRDPAEPLGPSCARRRVDAGEELPVGREEIHPDVDSELLDGKLQELPRLEGQVEPVGTPRLEDAVRQAHPGQTLRRADRSRQSPGQEASQGQPRRQQP
jgi:hypothetical protein